MKLNQPNLRGFKFSYFFERLTTMKDVITDRDGVWDLNNNLFNSSDKTIFKSYFYTVRMIR
jgi:hypothetical protein